MGSIKGFMYSNALRTSRYTDRHSDAPRASRASRGLGVKFNLGILCLWLSSLGGLVQAAEFPADSKQPGAVTDSRSQATESVATPTTLPTRHMPARWIAPSIPFDPPVPVTDGDAPDMSFSSADAILKTSHSHLDPSDLAISKFAQVKIAPRALPDVAPLAASNEFNTNGILIAGAAVVGMSVLGLGAMKWKGRRRDSARNSTGGRIRSST